MAENLSVGIVIGAALGSTFSSTFQTVEQRSKRLGDTLKQARIGAGLTGDVVKYKQQLDQLKRRQAQAGASGKSLSVEIGRVERRYRAAARKAKNYGLEIGAAARQHRQFSRTAREAEQSLGRLQRRQNRQAKRQNLRSRALPMVGGAFAVAAPIKGAIKFESVMADVKKVVNFDSPEQFKSMGRDILQLSEVIPMAAGGLADIVAAAGQAGIARSELLRFAEDAAKMGVAFDMSGKEAGGAMTGLRTQFQLNQDQVVSLGDAYNHLSNNMDATARDMLNVASRTGSTAQLVGLTGQQVGALASTFLALKTPSEVAGTGINALMLRLATANKQGRKFQDALAGIGLDAMGLKQSIKQDAQGALLSFLEAVKSSDDVVGTLSDLFGAEYADDMAKLVGNLGLYRKALGLVANETKFAGSMQKEYEERAKTTANNLQLLGNQFNRLGVNLGTVVLPAVRNVGRGLGWLAGGAADLADRFPGTTKAVVGLTLGLGGLVATAWVGSYTATLVGGAWDSAKFSAKKLGEAATWSRARLVAFNRTALVTATRTKALAVGGAIQSFGSSLIGLATRAIPAAIVGLKALTLAALSNPFVLIGVAVAGVAVLIWKYWEPIKAFLIGLWPPVKAAFTAVWEGIKSFFVSFHPLGLLISNWAPIVGFFGRLWTGIQSVFSAAWEGIKGFFLNYHPVGLVIKHWAPIVGFFGRLWTGIQSVFSAAWEGIKGFFLNYHPVGLVIKHWAPIVGFFGRLWTGIQSVFSAAWEGVVDWFGSLSLYEVGAAILTTLGEGIGSAIGWLGDKVKGVFGSIRKLLPFSDAKEGPLSGLTKSGQSILGTLGEGIRQAGPVALQRPLARTLGAATAGLALTVPASIALAASPLAAQPAPVFSLEPQAAPTSTTRPAGHTIHYHYGQNQITIHQQPNEDPQALAERILREMTRLQKQRRREEVYDGL